MISDGVLLKLDIDDVGYVIKWHERASMGGGYTVIRNLKVLSKNRIEHRDVFTSKAKYFSANNPQIRLFYDLNQLLEGEDQAWFKDLNPISSRILDQDELNILYSINKKNIADFFSPKEQAEIILPMFYRK